MKEKEFVKTQREFYDTYPLIMLEQDRYMLVSLKEFASDNKTNDEDKIIYHISPEEKSRIQKLIDEHNGRPPFDEKKCKDEFIVFQERTKKEAKNKLPPEILQQIIDLRVFSLGYCTSEVFKQLKKFSNENQNKMDHILNEYSIAQQEEPIPQVIKERFGFHDCELIELKVDMNIVMEFDTKGGFTDFNMITFTEAKIIKREDPILGGIWIYDELYSTESGYEAHILLWTSVELKDFIIRCNDIIIENNKIFN